MGGVAFNSVDQCFKQSLLKQMFNESIPLRIEFNTRFFVTVDPAAGGEHSDFAMVSFSYCHGICKVRSSHPCCCTVVPCSPQCRHDSMTRVLMFANTS